jgi:hypothetical protein
VRVMTTTGHGSHGPASGAAAPTVEAGHLRP